jgi:hypothetical protein
MIRTESQAMNLRSWVTFAIAGLPTALVHPACAQIVALPLETSQAVPMTISDVYIEQSHGLVSPGVKVPAKPVPEATGGGAIQSTGPTAPTTCNAQNASSQACYTATQQARPATR